MTEKQQMPAKGKVTHARLCKFSSPFGVEPITCALLWPSDYDCSHAHNTQHLNFVLWVFRDSVVSRIKSKHLNHQGSDRIGWCWKTFFFLQNLALCQGLFLLERWTPCMKPCSSRNEFDTGTPSHLVADHNQCLARTTFGHWSLEHHAGPAVPLSKHCTWRGLRSAESDWEICDFKIVYYR